MGILTCRCLFSSFDTFGSVISFGNHFHFNLGTFTEYPFSNHGTEHAVTAEIGISRHEKVAQINNRLYSGLRDVRYLRTGSFPNRIGNQYGLEVVSIFQTAADSGCNGIYILQHRSIFNAGYVRR